MRRDYDAALLMLPEDGAYLTIEEVLAVRLYSGPAYQPINEFLRQAGRLSGEHRVQLARHPSLTFSATTALICSALRKLAAVAQPQEASRPLYRGVRGTLPNAFWHEDRQGMITAVDTGFMSTSRNEQTPIDYMQGQYNVLWALHPQLQTDDAYHYGADISLLSQFPDEEECLFPPCTMMILRRPPTSKPDAPQPSAALSASTFTVTFAPGPLGIAFKTQGEEAAGAELGTGPGTIPESSASPSRSPMLGSAPAWLSTSMPSRLEAATGGGLEGASAGDVCVCVAEVVPGSPASLHNVPIGAVLLALNGDRDRIEGLRKAAVLKEIAAAGKEGPFTLTFSGAPLVGLGAPTVSSVHNQPLPPPKASKAAAAAPASAASVDPLDEARNLYSEPLERDGKRLVRLHVVPCFV